MSFSCEAPLLKTTVGEPNFKKQKTLARHVSASGVGLFTGVESTISLCPAEAETGIIFQRKDLPRQPQLSAKIEYVQGTPRCTLIGDSQGVSVQTVEHLLAALHAFGVDNVLIQLSGPEVPIFDGSSAQFVTMIEEAGMIDLEKTRPIYSIETPIYWSQGNIHLVALPSDEYRVSYTLHYPRCSAIGSQFYSVVVDQSCFKKELASCRTFSVYEEIAPMIEKGLVKGGSLENAVIIKENTVVNPEGLRRSDEMVRHKILDLIGDLALMPVLFTAHIIAICSGHASNNAFAKELFKHIKTENM